MAHKYGGIAFPVPVLDSSGSFPNPQTPLDVMLGYVGSFVATIMQVYVGAAWDEVSPSTKIIKSIQLNDPENGINEAWLPALFVYRPGRETREVVENFEQVADEYRFQKGRLVIRWVMNPVQQINDRARNNIIDAVRKVVDAAVNEGRDINWIIPEDPDPKAVTFGSSLCNYSGAAAIELDNAAPGQFALTMNLPAPQRKYDELKMSFLVEELLQRDITLIGAPNTTGVVSIVSPDQGTTLGDLTLGEGHYE